MFELDHIFILTSPGAPEADVLLSHLAEGPPNTHPGQGTSCRRFYFSDNYLELLYVDNTAEAQSPLTSPTHLYPRWLNRTTACPFGLVLRPNSPIPPVAAPFPSFQYNPTYLPPGLSLAIANNAANLREPALTYLPLRRTAASAPSVPRLIAANFRGPWPSTYSAAFSAISNIPLVTFLQAPQYHLELQFASGMNPADFRPVLPLELH